MLPFSDKQLLLVQLLPLPGSHPGFPLPLLPAEFLVPKGMGLFLFHGYYNTICLLTEASGECCVFASSILRIA